MSSLRRLQTCPLDLDALQMWIRLKLMGVLKDKTPADEKLELPEGSNILDVLNALDIPADSVQTFTVNAQLVLDKSRVLSPNDELSIVPPAVGG